jgi:hypothetical protein
MMQHGKEIFRDNRGAAITGAIITVLGLAASLIIGLPPLFMLGLLIAFGLATWGIYRWRSRGVEPRPARAPGGTLASSALVAVVVVFLAAQAVPYGRDHSNAPTTGEPEWATPETRELVQRACFDCHSNEVTWPWYSNVAPMSWAIWKHVKDGRNKVNYSEFDRPQREADESRKEVKQGSMPPPYYTFGGLHSDANLSADELAALIEGLGNTPGLSE